MTKEQLFNLHNEASREAQAQAALGEYGTDASKILYLLSAIHRLAFHLYLKEPEPKLPKKAKTHARNRKAPAKAK